MTNSATYFKEYNQKPERKRYLAQKARERYRQQKKGMGKLTCPNCSAVCEFQLAIKD